MQAKKKGDFIFPARADCKLQESECYPDERLLPARGFGGSASKRGPWRVPRSPKLLCSSRAERLGAWPPASPAGHCCPLARAS